MCVPDVSSHPGQAGLTRLTAEGPQQCTRRDTDPSSDSGRETARELVSWRETTVAFPACCQLPLCLLSVFRPANRTNWQPFPSKWRMTTTTHGHGLTERVSPITGVRPQLSSPSGFLRYSCNLPQFMPESPDSARFGSIRAG